MVTIDVGTGKDAKKFYIYAGLLKHYSSYFRSALKEVWQEGATQTITLAEDSPTVFSTFFHWLYSGKLYSHVAPNGKVPLSENELCTLYIFGDVRGAPEFCNAAVDVLFQRFAGEWAYPVHSLPYVYENTPTRSKLRNVLVDIAVETFGFTNLKEAADSYPKEFLVEVVLRSCHLKTYPGCILLSKQKYFEKKVAEMCMYHNHDDPHASRPE